MTLARTLTAPRKWPFPDLRNGTTIHHITDTHFNTTDASESLWMPNWMDRIVKDAEVLRFSHHGHVHTGDAIDWQATGAAAADDAEFVAWKNSMLGADGMPFALAVGNHDLGGGPSGGRAERTTAQWATAMGVSSQNTVTTMGDMQVITIGPDEWGYDGNGDRKDFILSSATITWLAEQLEAAGSTPCWIAAHVPLVEHLGPSGNFGKSRANEAPANAGLDTVLADYPNAIGWLSGHLHISIENANHVQSHALNVGGRRIFSINGPGAGGANQDDNPGTGLDRQWWDDSKSMYVTYLGDAIDVRWRDHLARSWTTSGAERVKHVLLTP